MAESEDGLRSLFMTVKEESAKAGLKLNIKKTKILTTGPIRNWKIDGEDLEVVPESIYLGSKITEDAETAATRLSDGCSSENKPWYRRTRYSLAKIPA
ncbi:hypothetical protein M514_09508 [Trichuris suis]|uniref:Reverse transcriptase domain-containing protein n=1 Tax=Trichuris suis TaxID=68888 RepID=A0A085NA38_9BILA|nr:hypothetical protein M513_09508 [Trichuris suis]KFD66334.1 hypothetical protein M514_09508 [Trichuris suis]